MPAATWVRPRKDMLGAYRTCDHTPSLHTDLVPSIEAWITTLHMLMSAWLLKAAGCICRAHPVAAAMVVGVPVGVGQTADLQV